MCQFNGECLRCSVVRGYDVDQLTKLEHKESEHRMASSHDRTEIKTARSTIDYLEKVVRDKNEKIADIVGENLTDPDSGQIPFKDFVRLTAMVDQLATAMANGDIETARSNLPPHYTYLPSDFKVKRIRRVSYLAREKLPSIQKAELKHASHTNGTETTGDAAGYIIEAIVDNPQLVNPDDNVVNFINCMRHFPHLSVEFIKDHWAKFREFDANGDTTLDFSEVVRALTAMGFHFTAQQAEEAMREADVNHSKSLDFYEYVLVADKLIHRTGRSELFHTSPQDRKVLSKTCVLQ
ncbi:hypothetical protein ACOMHN_015414 [Nucella lapillus]